jgi:hypothetical protein
VSVPGEYAHDSVSAWPGCGQPGGGALVLVRLLSVLLAILQFHGFTLREDVAA